MSGLLEQPPPTPPGVDNCEEGELYRIIENTNQNTNSYYSEGKIIRVIKVNHEKSDVFRCSNYSVIQPESYKALPAVQFQNLIAPLGFLKSDLNRGITLEIYNPAGNTTSLCTQYDEVEDENSNKRYRCSSPAAGGKSKRKSNRRKRKGRKRKTTKRNKRQ